MKIEDVNGVQHIILEPNDKIEITTKEFYKSNAISLEYSDARLNIIGDSELINEITGDGMLEKVYIAPTLSAEEIVNICDEWLETFFRVHDEFKELVLTEKYMQQNINMELSFSEYWNGLNKGHSIDLNLQQFGVSIQDGMRISVPAELEDVYRYLLANVLAYFMDVNFEDYEIKCYGDWQGKLIVQNRKENLGEIGQVLIYADLSSLFDSYQYKDIIISIAGNHNVGNSSKQLINNFRSKIGNHRLSSDFIKSIEYSKAQLAFILPELAKKTEKTRKRVIK